MKGFAGMLIVVMGTWLGAQTVAVAGLVVG
jgi:hypothetical protein